MLIHSSRIGLDTEIGGQPGSDRGVVHLVVRRSGVSRHHPQDARFLLRELNRSKPRPLFSFFISVRFPRKLEVGAGVGGVKIGRLGRPSEERGPPCRRGLARVLVGSGSGDLVWDEGREVVGRHRRRV